MKKIITAIITVLLNSCSNPANNTDKIIKDNTIDSLRTELKDCKSQAQIMAEILEDERIKNLKESKN